MKSGTPVFRRRAAALFAVLGLSFGSAVASAPTAEAAGPLPSATTVTASASTVTYGSPVTLTATVSVLGLGLLITPSGSVTFSTAAGTLGTVALSSPCILTACTASLTTNDLAVGDNTITATFGGDTLSSASSATTSVFATQPPTAPTGLSATAGDHVVNLSWAAPASSGSSAVTGYKVYRNTTASGSFVYLGSTTGTTYADSAVVNGTTEYYYVTATNSTNEGPQSSTVSATPTASAPSAPVLSGPTSALDKLTITWTTPASSAAITGYKIYRATSAGASTLLTTVGVQNSYIDTTVTAPTTYYYRVKAVSSAGDSAYSNEVSGVATAPTVPSTPTITATPQTGTIKLAWSSSSTGGRAITSYKLYRSTSAGGSYTLIASGLPSGNYQDTTIPVGVTYYYKGTSVNVVGESAQSSSASAAATAYSGGSSASSTGCTAGSACTGGPVTGTYNGSATDGTISVESSSGSHTATLAISNTKLTGCTVPVSAGLSLVFNDTSTDAYKSVGYKINGADAQAWDNYYTINGFPGSGELCLGLGTPWLNGQGFPVTWTPADGLYEGRVVACVNNGAYVVSPGHYSQPCFQRSAFLSGPVSGWYYNYTILLPPGDGKISQWQPVI